MGEVVGCVYQRLLLGKKLHRSTKRVGYQNQQGLELECRNSLSTRISTALSSGFSVIAKSRDNVEMFFLRRSSERFGNRVGRKVEISHKHLSFQEIERKESERLRNGIRQLPDGLV